MKHFSLMLTILFTLTSCGKPSKQGHDAPSHETSQISVNKSTDTNIKDQKKVLEKLKEEGNKNLEIKKHKNKIIMDKITKKLSEYMEEYELLKDNKNHEIDLIAINMEDNNSPVKDKYQILLLAEAIYNEKLVTLEKKIKDLKEKIIIMEMQSAIFLS